MQTFDTIDTTADLTNLENSKYVIRHLYNKKFFVIVITFGLDSFVTFAHENLLVEFGFIVTNHTFNQTNQNFR